MKSFYQVVVIGLMFTLFFIYGVQSVLFAADGRVLAARQAKSAPAVTLKDFKSNSLKALRRLKEKQEFQRFREILEARRRTHCPAPQTPNPPQEPPASQAAAIQKWVTESQAQNPDGLVASFPEDAALKDQAFTYDQALAGLLLLGQKDTASAKKILDFYISQWDGQGFYTVYNTQDPVNGPKVETHRIVGPTAWVGLFALKYHELTGDESALDLATQTGKWVAEKVPHSLGGGIVMGDNDIWSGIVSIENNLSYFALAEGLSKTAKDPADKTLFTSEKDALAAFIKNEGYDASTGLFKRGPSDQTSAFDVNTWAILIFGADKLQESFGIDAAAFVARIENTFAVQKDGTFGGNILAAKGFDFSDASNASIAGRGGMNWVEGTNHMVLVYQELARSVSAQNPALARQYRDKAAYFLKMNAQNAVTQGGKTSYKYTDAPGGTLIFHDIQGWRTPSGPGLASSAWVYFAEKGINPLDT